MSAAKYLELTRKILALRSLGTFKAEEEKDLITEADLLWGKTTEEERAEIVSLLKEDE